MRKIKVSAGVYWVEIPEAGLNILCGCPADSVKHLMKKGLIVWEEKNGVKCETGPNAILLSDVSLQNERFSNLGEFPVLQMLYRQGTILPGHPNNTGEKPMIIGIADQVKAQAEYIFRGNYGLKSMEELQKAGATEEEARELMRIKLRFAFGKIRETRELLDLKIVAEKPIELKNGVSLTRKASNHYEFSYKGETCAVDLNLAAGETYETTYQLGFHEIERDYFSVIHIGEGDGWDVNRPCMGSLLTFQGKLYLIDAGPNIVHSLTALGISANEIEGIFHTHAHDDHFNGLPTLLRADHKIKYFAAPLVRKCVEKKLSALLAIDEGTMSDYFEICDLKPDKWNDIEGLEVKPAYSPHPVETTVMFFRALAENGHKTYAHLADIAALDALRGMVVENPNENGCTQALYDAVAQSYGTPVNLKKIDIGGGLIHGKAEDFAGDSSDKILLSHTAAPLTDGQKEIGASAAFGMADALIPSGHDYLKSLAFRNFHDYFAGAPRHELEMLMNCPVVAFNPGSMIVKNGEKNSHLFVILSGILEFIVADEKVRNYLSAGAIAGEISGLLGSEARGTHRAVSLVKALKAPCGLYVEFLKRNGLFERTKANLDLRNFLRRTWLFGEMISCPVKIRIAESLERVEIAKGEALPTVGCHDLFLVKSGKLSILHGESMVEEAAAGDFFGEENILYQSQNFLDAIAAEPSAVYRIPGEAIKEIPIVRWKLIETFERRMRRVGPKFIFA